MNLLQNKTVCLRAPEPEDLELLYSWENNPEWWEIGNTLAPYSRYLLKEYIAESHRGIFDLKQLRLMIDLCSTGATVGMLDRSASSQGGSRHTGRSALPEERTGDRSVGVIGRICFFLFEVASTLCAYPDR